MYCLSSQPDDPTVDILQLSNSTTRGWARTRQGTNTCLFLIIECNLFPPYSSWAMWLSPKFLPKSAEGRKYVENSAAVFWTTLSLPTSLSLPLTLPSLRENYFAFFLTPLHSAPSSTSDYGKLKSLAQRGISIAHPLPAWEVRRGDVVDKLSKYTQPKLCQSPFPPRP